MAYQLHHRPAFINVVDRCCHDEMCQQMLEAFRRSRNFLTSSVNPPSLASVLEVNDFLLDPIVDVRPTMFLFLSTHLPIMPSGMQMMQ